IEAPHNAHLHPDSHGQPGLALEIGSKDPVRLLQGSTTLRSRLRFSLVLVQPFKFLGSNGWAPQSTLLVPNHPLKSDGTICYFSTHCYEAIRRRGLERCSTRMVLF